MKFCMRISLSCYSRYTIWIIVTLRAKFCSSGRLSIKGSPTELVALNRSLWYLRWLGMCVHKKLRGLGLSVFSFITIFMQILGFQQVNMKVLTESAGIKTFSPPRGVGRYYMPAKWKAILHHMGFAGRTALPWPPSLPAGCFGASVKGRAGVALAGDALSTAQHICPSTASSDCTSRSGTSLQMAAVNTPTGRNMVWILGAGLGPLRPFLGCSCGNEMVLMGCCSL